MVSALETTWVGTSALEHDMVVSRSKLSINVPLDGVASRHSAPGRDDGEHFASTAFVIPRLISSTVMPPLPIRSVYLGRLDMAMISSSRHSFSLHCARAIDLVDTLLSTHDWECAIWSALSVAGTA